MLNVRMPSNFSVKRTNKGCSVLNIIPLRSSETSAGIPPMTQKNIYWIFRLMSGQTFSLYFRIIPAEQHKVWTVCIVAEQYKVWTVCIVAEWSDASWLRVWQRPYCCLSSLLLYSATVGPAWSLMGSPQTDRTAEQQHSVCLWSGQSPLVARLAVLHFFATRLFTSNQKTSQSELRSSGLLHSE
jgi:hypothetical protein